MTKRGWWLVGMNFLIPGSAQVLAGNRKLGRFGLAATLLLWTLALVALVLYFVARGVLFSAVTMPAPLLVLQVLLAAYAVLWLVLTLDTIRLARLAKAYPAARLLVAGLAVVSLVATAGPASYGAYLFGVQRGFVSTLFGTGPTADPVDGQYNILLLGADAGPDRQGLRPDSITVVSIDAETGETTMIGLPRNLVRAPFSAGSPMQSLYPDGYKRCNVDVCMLNSIYTEVQLYSPELYPNAEAIGSQPGIEAMRDAAEGVTGLEIQYFGLIDMQGFADLIDALGGVTIDVKTRVAMGAGHDENNNPVPIDAWIEPGVQNLDGFHALWYARSRYLTSDYDRMARQRELQQAIIQQFDPLNVLTKFEGIADAGAQVVKTDIPQSMLGYFTQLAMKARDQPVTELAVTMPLTDPENPDYDVVHAAIAAATAP
ncbi:LCP family protein [Planctomonas psychrotolerans]|uniref:LCP family protein n=1 Tax=Planctomonas psychrotolerans TaxID=2528712 RepID=UPI001D0D58E8|nr:LCP family protein [Planctomonas psychrotolerans]